MYRNPCAAHARIIPHDYADASDNFAQYEADQKGLQAVTLAMMAEPAIGCSTFFTYSQPYPNEPGSWQLCESADAMVDGSAIDIWTYNGACLERQEPTLTVYVSRRNLEALGYAIPANERKIAWDALFDA